METVALVIRALRYQAASDLQVLQFAVVLMLGWCHKVVLHHLGGILHRVGAATGHRNVVSHVDALSFRRGDHRFNCAGVDFVNLVGKFNRSNDAIEGGRVDA